MSPILVFIHISMGAVGLASGTAALTFRKGSPWHRKTGNIFFVSMLIMAALGSLGALYKPEMISVLNGLLTVYFVATAWTTVRRKAGQTRLFDFAALVFVLAVGTTHISFGMEAANSASGSIQGFPSVAYYIFGSVAFIAAAMDILMIYRGGVVGKHRIVRHLWRMCFALFVAVASLFLGQQQVFPEAVRGTFALAVPVILVIGISFFWLVRVLFTKRYR